MKRWFLGAFVCAGLFAAGCGSTGQGSGSATAGSGAESAASRTAPPGPPAAPALGAFDVQAKSDNARPTPTPTPAPGAVTHTVDLRPGWNSVGFKCSKITSMQIPPEAIGLAFFDGAGYPTRPLREQDANDEDEGPRRGFWIFARSKCQLRYTGINDGKGDYVKLKRGWNLVSFTTAQAVAGTELKAVLPNGRPVDLNTVVLPQFFAIGLDNGQLTVDVLSGDELEPGRCYWVFSLAKVYLVFGRPPAPEPEGSPTPAASPVASPTASPVASPAASPGASPAASPTATPQASPTPAVSPTPAASPARYSGRA